MLYNCNSNIQTLEIAVLQYLSKTNKFQHVRFKQVSDI